MQPNGNSKRHSQWYILTIIALIIAFVIVQLILLGNAEEEQTADENHEVPASEIESFESTQSEKSIDQYLVFVSENTPDDQNMPMHDYISSAITYLTQALQQLTEEDVIQLNQSTIKQLRNQSKEIAKTEEVNKSIIVKRTFSMISETMQSLALKDTEQLQHEMGNLEQMVNAIQQEVDIAEQNIAVSQFLAQAGLVLELIEEEA